MKKYHFNDDIPAEEAVALIRAVERYANAVESLDYKIVFAILGITEMKEGNDGSR
jgi:hypothetical protein|nr:MAG TPA: hypothetical protein [Caudoviricetes sp.]